MPRGSRMRSGRRTRRRGVAAWLSSALALALLAGCGHSAPIAPGGVPIIGTPGEIAKAAENLGFPGFATKNTTRVGGADPISDAAAVSQAVYVSASASSRPEVVTLVDLHSWQASLAAALFMSPPMRAPLLFTDGGSLPAATSSALGTLAPSGSAAAGGAQVLRVDNHADSGTLHARDVTGANPFAIAAAIDRLQIAASGSPSAAVVVVAADQPAYAMPAAGWAAKSGDPILYVTRDAIPPETVAALRAHQHPHIYILGPPSTVSQSVASGLRTLGAVKRIAGNDPVSNSIAFSRYYDGSFGWGVTDPGHGLVFANSSRPLDAAAAAPLSASGGYGPLLLTNSSAALPSLLDGALLDIRPAYDKDPARGFYNHGWLIGDQHAISLAEQAQIDALLEIAPVNAAPPAAAPITPAPSSISPTPPATTPAVPTSLPGATRRRSAKARAFPVRPTSATGPGHP